MYILDHFNVDKNALDNTIRVNNGTLYSILLLIQTVILQSVSFSLTDKPLKEEECQTYIPYKIIFYLLISFFT